MKIVSKHINELFDALSSIDFKQCLSDVTKHPTTRIVDGASGEVLKNVDYKR